MGVEQHRPFVEAVVGQTRRDDGREEPYLERLCEPTGTASSEPLRLDGNGVRVPELKMWGIVAIERDGPAADPMPSDVKPLYPAPNVPDVTAPLQSAKASEWE